MSVQTIIERKLLDSFDPRHLEVVNESHRHNVPSGSETHFRVTICSVRFENENLVRRHRLVNDSLAQELAGPVHALAIHALTPAEWLDREGRTAESPKCLGGSRAG